MKEIFNGIFEINGKLYTENLVKSFNPFSEELINSDKREFRSFDPTRSKLSAAIMKKIKEVPLSKGTRLVYLGAAHGMTVSHISNIVGGKGFIYAIEFSDKPFEELLPIASKLKNIAPLFVDARKPEIYQW